MLLYGIFQVLFQIVLHCFIDGQHQALSVLRIVDLLLTEGHGSSLGVAHRGDDAVGTGQGLVVVGFQPIGAGAVVAGKAQHGGRQVAIGIIAHGIFAEIDALDVIFLDEGCHFIGGVVVHLLLDGLIIPPGLERFFIDHVVIHIEDLRKTRSHQLPLVLLHLRRRNEHRPDGDALGKCFHIAVIDIAAVGGNGCGIHLLTAGFFLPHIRLDHLQIKQTDYKNGKACAQRHDNQPCARPEQS